MSNSDVSAQDRPDYRFVLLGASNLTLGLPRLVTSLRKALPGSVEILAAHGHGRSYLGWSHVLFRGLPSIRDCDLWAHLEERPAAKQTYGLITDLGCDLFYGAMPQQIVESVSECLERLQKHDATVVFARPPLERFYQMTDWHYYFARNLFFPSNATPWATMKKHITEVDEGAYECAQRLGIYCCTPRLEWYGRDPIHMQRTKRTEAWAEMLTGWELPSQFEIIVPELRDALRIWTRTPHRRKFFKTERTTPQPILRWDDGSNLSVY